jgi:hypothetical protein
MKTVLDKFNNSKSKCTINGNMQVYYISIENEKMIQEALTEPAVDDGLMEAIARAKTNIHYCEDELKSVMVHKVGWGEMTYADIQTLIAHAVKQEKVVEVDTTDLCVKILDTRPNKEFGTWQVIEVLQAIKGLGLKIIGTSTQLDTSK